MVYNLIVWSFVGLVGAVPGAIVWYGCGGGLPAGAAFGAVLALVAWRWGWAERSP